MKKRLASVLVMVFVLIIAGCGDSNIINSTVKSDEESSNITDDTERMDIADSKITDDTERADGKITGGTERTREAGDKITDITKQTDAEKYGGIIKKTVDTEDTPVWAMGTQVDGELYQNLNLDGIGNFDDEAYVSICQFGDYEDKVTVVSIHLGTGETVARVFSVYGDCTLQTGRIFSEDKDAVILEICDSTSNYGAATVFVMDVSPAKVYGPIPSAGILLNTTEAVTLADGEIVDTTSLPNLVTGGTKVVDIDGMPRQGVLIYSTGEDGEYQGLPRIFYWMGRWRDGGWAIIPDKSSENDDRTRIDEGEIYAYIVGTNADKISIAEMGIGWNPDLDPDLTGLHEGLVYSVKNAFIQQLTLSADCVIDVIPEPYDERQIVSAEEFTAYLQEQWPNLIPYTLTISDGEITEIMEHYIP